MKKKNVLIYRVGQLGDTLVAIPALQALARQHSESRLVLLTDRHATKRGYVSSWDVIGPTGWFDEVIFYEPRDQSALGQLKQMSALLMKLRPVKYDYVYNLVMRTSERAVQRDRFFFRHLVGAKHYCGLPSIDYPPPDAKLGQMKSMPPEWSRLLLGIGESTDIAFRLTIPEVASTEVMKIWPDYVRANEVRTVILAPGSKMSAKRWPEENFARLGQQLLEEDADTRIVVVGGQEDALLGERLCSAWGTKALNFAGKLSIYGSAALMKCCSLFVGNDSGAMHLAALVGLPCVAIFSSRDYPGLWEPYGSHHAILRRELPCSGCMLGVCSENGNACLKGITVDAVLNAIAGKLNSKVPKTDH